MDINNSLPVNTQNATLKSSKTLNKTISYQGFSLTVFTSPKPLCKVITLDSDGQLKKQAAILGSGKAEQVTVSNPSDLAELIESFTSYQCLSLGVCEAEKVLIGTTGHLKAGEIPRTNKTFSWSSGGGLLCLDIDTKDPQSVARKKLCDAFPWLVSCAQVWMRSSSNGIYNSQTGESTSGGYHVYFFLEKASDNPDIHKAIYNGLWLAGQGHHELDKAGRVLERCLIDGSTCQPSRIFYEAAPRLVHSALSRPGGTVAFIQNGARLTLDAVLLSEQEASLVETIKAKNKLTVADSREARAKQAAFLESKPQAQRAALQRVLKSSALDSDAQLTLEDGTVVTVAAILRRPKTYHGVKCFDPILGGDRVKAIIYTNQDTPQIHSFKSGGHNYSFSRKALAEARFGCLFQCTEPEKTTLSEVLALAKSGESLSLNGHTGIGKNNEFINPLVESVRAKGGRVVLVFPTCSLTEKGQADTGLKHYAKDHVLDIAISDGVATTLHSFDKLELLLSDLRKGDTIILDEFAKHAINLGNNQTIIKNPRKLLRIIRDLKKRGVQVITTDATHNFVSEAFRCALRIEKHFYIEETPYPLPKIKAICTGKAVAAAAQVEIEKALTDGELVLVPTDSAKIGQYLEKYYSSRGYSVNLATGATRDEPNIKRLFANANAEVVKKSIFIYTSCAEVGISITVPHRMVGIFETGKLSPESEMQMLRRGRAPIDNEVTAFYGPKTRTFSESVPFQHMQSAIDNAMSFIQEQNTEYLLDDGLSLLQSAFLKQTLLRQTDTMGARIGYFTAAGFDFEVVEAEEGENDSNIKLIQQELEEIKQEDSEESVKRIVNASPRADIAKTHTATLDDQAQLRHYQIRERCKLKKEEDLTFDFVESCEKQALDTKTRDHALWMRSCSGGSLAFRDRYTIEQGEISKRRYEHEQMLLLQSIVSRLGELIEPLGLDLQSGQYATSTPAARTVATEFYDEIPAGQFHLIPKPPHADIDPKGHKARRWAGKVLERIGLVKVGSKQPKCADASRCRVTIYGIANDGPMSLIPEYARRSLPEFERAQMSYEWHLAHFQPELDETLGVHTFSENIYITAESVHDIHRPRPRRDTPESVHTFSENIYITAESVHDTRKPTPRDQDPRLDAEGIPLPGVKLISCPAITGY